MVHLYKDGGYTMEMSPLSAKGTHPGQGYLTSDKEDTIN